MSNAGNHYAERAAAGDPTLLHDQLGVAIDVLSDLRSEVIEHMEETTPCRGKPGSAAKVEAMRLRAEAGQSIFSDKDRTRE